MQVERTAMDIAWAAGLFEGEGCMSTGPRKPGGRGVQVRLGMTDRDVVERFARVMDVGNIHRREDARGWKPVHTWVLYEAAEVIRVIEMLMPYFGERRGAKALEVIAVAREIHAHNSKKTHCPKGHALEGENLIVEPIQRAGKQYAARRCRECRRRQSRERARTRIGIDPTRFRITD